MIPLFPDSFAGQGLRQTVGTTAQPAVILAEGAFETRGPVAHGTVAAPYRFDVRAVVDSTCAGSDAGVLLDRRARASASSPIWTVPACWPAMTAAPPPSSGWPARPAQRRAARRTRAGLAARLRSRLRTARLPLRRPGDRPHWPAGSARRSPTFAKPPRTARCATGPVGSPTSGHPDRRPGHRLHGGQAHHPRGCWSRRCGSRHLRGDDPHRPDRLDAGRRYGVVLDALPCDFVAGGRGRHAGVRGRADLTSWSSGQSAL